MKHGVLLALFAVLTWGGAWAQSVAVAEPNWSGLDGEVSPELTRLWSQVQTRLALDLGARLSNAADARVQSFVSGKAGAYSVVLQLSAGAKTPAARYLPLDHLDEADALGWVRGIEALVRSAWPLATEAAPMLVDSFVVSTTGIDLPPSAVGAPTAIAVRPDGRLWVGLGSSVLELDDKWMVTGQPAKALTAAGTVNFAWSMAVSPAGSLLVRSADGSTVWTLAGDAPARTLGSPLPSAGLPLGVLTDGTPFGVSSQPKVVRFWGVTGPRDLPLGSESLVMAAASGPENTLWIWDAFRSVIRVVTVEGWVRDVVVPDLPSGVTLLRLRVDADGWFWGITTNDLRRFRPDGSLAWAWAGAPGASPGFGTLADVAPGPRGLVYLSDYLSHRIYRLTTRPSDLDPGLALVAAARERVTQSSDADAWGALAETYQDQGALIASLDAWNRYLELRPADAKARSVQVNLTANLGMAQAKAGAAETARLLDTLGPESARESYSRTMKTLEALRATVPGDKDVTQALAELRRRFATADASVTESAPVPRVTEVVLSSLFPSLIRAYRTKPAGSISVVNDLAEPLTNLTAEVFLPRFMDYPSVGPGVPRLAPGSQVEVPLAVTLNDRVLDLEEDLPIQASITLRWTDSRGPRFLQVLRPVTLYRRTALTWDDTGKLAAFVTPHEEVVAQTAFSLLPEASALPLGTRNVDRAAALITGLGSLPLLYVPDPQTSFATAAGDTGVVDTVRFPRTTLGYRGGDCDDTTALTASVLEAVGIPTAFVTTPGHIFLAFDTGEPAASAWLFAGTGLQTLIHGGRLWIPIETTVLSQGFATAWQSASRLVARYQGNADFQFLAVEDLQVTYPALPLPPSRLPGPVFDRPTLKLRGESTAKDLETLVLGALSKTLSGNRLARAQASWGRPDLAKATLQALAAGGHSAAACLNLATLARAEGDAPGAARWLQAAQKADPGSPLVAGYLGQLKSAQPGPLAVLPESGGRGAQASVLPPWVE